jgi:hypothetical protein
VSCLVVSVRRAVPDDAASFHAKMAARYLFFLTHFICLTTGFCFSLFRLVSTMSLASALFAIIVCTLGICIEPNPIYWYRLAFRKCHALGTIVGANDYEEVQVVLGTEHRGPYSGIVGNDFDNKKAPSDAVKRYTAGLKTLLERFQAPVMIDYLSLDVEGAETFIMKGFPFDSYKFKVLTVERPKEELQKILTLHGYEKILDLKRGDTLWAHASIRDAAVANLAKNPDEIRTKVIKDWPAHVANKA